MNVSLNVKQIIDSLPLKGKTVLITPNNEADLLSADVVFTASDVKNLGNTLIGVYREAVFYRYHERPRDGLCPVVILDGIDNDVDSLSIYGIIYLDSRYKEHFYSYEPTEL